MAKHLVMAGTCSPYVWETTSCLISLGWSFTVSSLHKTHCRSTTHGTQLDARRSIT